MEAQRSKKEWIIFGVTGSTGLADRNWGELLRPRRSGPSLSNGSASSAAGELWRPDAIEEPIEPALVR